MAYEYTVIGDEYRFSELKAGIEGQNADWEDYEEYYGDLTFRGDVNANIAELNGDRFNGVKIDDNAQVLLYWAKDGADADWDVVSITGKKFNDIADVADLLNGKGVVAGAAAYGFSGRHGRPEPHRRAGTAGRRGSGSQRDRHPDLEPLRLHPDQREVG